MTQPQEKAPSLFLLVRDVDETGVSGTGVVAKGVELASGFCLMKWVVGPARSIAVYESIGDLVTIHGHGGKTRVEYVENTDGEDLGALGEVASMAENVVLLVGDVARMALTA